MFALAADGKTNRKGMPNPLRLAVIANSHFDTVQLPFPPAILQRIALGMGAPLGSSSATSPPTRPQASQFPRRRKDEMRRRLIITALFLALLLLALLGFVMRLGRTPAYA